MLRHSPSRNQRSKGFKVKQVLQTCLLLAVCFWLIYQVKHSHDKKKEFDETDAKLSIKSQSGGEILKLGRKDLHPEVEDTPMKNVKHDEEETEEETGGEEVNKHEEEEQEEDSKSEEKENEGGGDGDDEIGENDQEKSDEVDHEEEFIDEEKEREEGDEKEGEERDVEDKGEMENEKEDHDHDEDGRNAHEAREEQYKADDASSAVTHDAQTIGTENENSSENSNENSGVNILEQENNVNNTQELNVDQNTAGLKAKDDETDENGNSSNATANEQKGYEIVSSKSEESPLSTSTIPTESNNQPEVGNNSTEISTEAHVLSPPNGTDIILDSTQAQNVTRRGTTTGEGSILQTISLENTSNSNIVSDNNQSDFNSTNSAATENSELNAGESSNSSTNSGFFTSEKFIRSNVSAELVDGSGSSRTEENGMMQAEKSDTSNGTDGAEESLGSSSKTENADEVQHDPIDLSDSSIPLEEKESRTDLDTLPEITAEGTNSEDAAAE